MFEQNNPVFNSPTPFFARYLEGQLEDLSAAELEAIAGGETFVTQAFPSDQEDTGDGVVTTKKYPSDQEDSDVETTSKTMDYDFHGDRNLGFNFNDFFS